MEERKSVVRVGKPNTDHWKTFAVGRNYFALVAVNGMRDGFSSVYLAVTGPNSKPHLHLIKQRHQQEIEATFGASVQWRELPNNNESQIVLRRASTPIDKASWPELNAWFAETLEKMDALFRPIVREVDASDYVSPETLESARDGAGDLRLASP